jgi:hypothetical protein
MTTKSIEQFFAGKILEIPSYQRDYAWEPPQVDDLFDDIVEAMEMGGSHYLGTFILSEAAGAGRYKVVDGQQRLTTLTMLVDAMVDALPDGEVKTYYRATYIHHPVHGAKFTVLGANHTFFQQLLNDEACEPVTEGQTRLKTAYGWIRSRVGAIVQAEGIPKIQAWLVQIGKLEVLEFIEPDEGKAIRMFQSVNDRGVPLSKMDIAKSLLIYYSNRFLAGRLDALVSESFGCAFRDYSRMKGLASEPGYKIRHIDRANFREDDVFRYHYFAFNADSHGIESGFDYNATSETVLERFLKPTLKALRGDPVRLERFVTDYVNDLARFFASLKGLVEQTRSDLALYHLLVVGDLASTLYPLTIRLAMRGNLTETIPSAGGRTLLEIIEVADLRVFKIRGTNPQADILWLARECGAKPAEDVASYLCWFIEKFMDDGLFRSRLTQEGLYRNPGLVRILYALEEHQRGVAGLAALTLNELAELAREGHTVEHVLPQETSFGIRAYGFHTAEVYENNIHRLGNLTLLERRINSACNNQSVEIKTSDQNLYRASAYASTKAIAVTAANRTVAFNRDDINGRCEQQAAFCATRWPIYPDQPPQQ